KPAATCKACFATPRTIEGFIKSSKICSMEQNRLVLPLTLSLLVTTVCLPLMIEASGQKARRQTPQASAPTSRTSATGSLKVVTGLPGSVVFINNVRHGATGDNGELDLPHVRAGSYPGRVRTVGYIDWTGSVTITTASRTLKVTQQQTSDEATLHYQKAEALRDKGKNKDAVEEYKQTLVLRPSLVEARIAMARCLITLQDFQGAEKEIQT